MNGLPARLLVAAIGFLLIGCSGSADESAPKDASSQSVPDDAPARVPEGQLLLYANDRPLILSHIQDEPIHLRRPGETIWAGDLSPDGSEVLAMPFQREPTGITREPRIVVVDVGSGDRSTAVRVGPRGDLGPALWSPDGTRIAYRKTIYPVDPAEVHPGPHGDRRTALCILDRPTELTRCFTDLRRIDGFDWAPDGKTLLVDVVGPRPLWLLDPFTGRTSVLVPPRGRWIEHAGLTKPVSFISPGWSPSGKYVAAWVNNTPVVFQADGRLAAVGRPGGSFMDVFGWSPAEDLFAYPRGEPPYFTEIRILDPETGDDRRLISARGNAYLYGFAWSPSGRWAAILRWRSSVNRIDVIDDRGVLPRTTVYRADFLRLLDWGP